MASSTKIRRTPYKDFLQPALQRRFVLNSALVLVISYFEAVVVGSWSSPIWIWFPISRTFFFFICAFALVLLRIAHYHVGVRPTSSAYQIVSCAIFEPKSYEIIFTYAVFGWLFGQVYLWHVGERNNLQWITYAYHVGDRPRLNEKPILFGTFFATLGVTHGLYHIAMDLDRLPLGIVMATAASKDKNKAKQDPSLAQLVNTKLPTAITHAIVVTVAALALHVFLYVLLLRPLAWGWTLSCMRWFYNLPKSNMLPSTYPYHLWLFIRMAWAGFLLSFLWVTGNIGFTVLMNTEPLKHGKPITSESKDRNGSLLNGLKSKKISIRCFAMWELAFIARDFEDRRKAMFEDIDRKEGPIWSQVYHICLDVIKSVEANIDRYGKAPDASVVNIAHKIEDQTGKEEPKQRVSSKPPRNDAILVAKAEGSSNTFGRQLQKQVEAIARNPGKTPLGELSPRARKAMTDAKDRYLTKEQQETMTTKHMQSAFKMHVSGMVDTQLGWLVRQDFRRRLATTIFSAGPGQPCEVSLYANAVTVLAKLAVNSLREDKYGQVQKDVGTIVRTFTVLATKLERFRVVFPAHWLDGKTATSKTCREVDVLLSALRESITELLKAFEIYADDLGLSRADVRQAKEAAFKEDKVEMEQVRWFE